jgi:hypothetical protein
LHDRSEFTICDFGLGLTSYEGFGFASGGSTKMSYDPKRSSKEHFYKRTWVADYKKGWD